MNQNLIKTIVQAIKQTEPRTKAYDTQATVMRIEGSMAWVHIPGGVAETPVKMTIAAKPGDTVQVRVSGGRAFMVGNASAPPTDDTVAAGAVRQISAVKKVVQAVKEVAETASRIAGNTNQYFWHTQEGIDTGAHITEIPQDKFLADPAAGGGNLLARSNGVAIRDGLVEVAEFDKDSVTFNDSDGDATAEFGGSGFFIGQDANTKISYDAANGLKLGQNVSILPTGIFQMSYDHYSFSIDTVQKYMYMNAYGNIMRLGDEGFYFILEGQQYRVDAPGGSISLMAYNPVLLSGNIAQLYLEYRGGNATAALIGKTIELEAASGIKAIGNILPDQENTRYLGNSSHRWQNLYTHYVNASGAITAGAVASYTPTWGTGQTPVRYSCVVSAGICHFSFMGAAIAHNNGDLICNLPVGARPSAQINPPFIKMAGGVMGVLQITTAGAVTVAQITNSSNTGRIYLSCSFPVV